MSERGSARYGVDHDFERAIEGMDEDTVRAMYYVLRAERDKLAEACERRGQALEHVKREASSLIHAEPSVEVGHVRPVGRRSHKIARDAELEGDR